MIQLHAYHGWGWGVGAKADRRAYTGEMPGSHYDLPTILASIERAFLPLRCVVDDFDYKEKVRFRVFSPEGEALLRVDEQLVRRLREPDGLAYTVGAARRNLEARGFVLEPWVPPALPTESE